MLRASVLLLGMLLLAGSANAQLTFVSIDSVSSSLSENFDTIGSGEHALLPQGWRIGISADFSLGKNSTTESAGTTGLGALNINSPGGFYNFANGENATSTDRAVGFLTDNENNQNKNLLVGLQNNSGATINDISFSFDAEKYRSGIRANDIRLFYGFDGLSWIEVPEGLVHYAPDAATAVVNPPSTTSKSIALSNLNLPDQGKLYFRWFYTFISSVTFCQALGIDNFQLNVGPAQQPDLVWDGASGASWDASASNWKNSAGAHVGWSDNLPNNATFVDGGANVTTLVSLSSARRVGRLTFDAGLKSYTLSGGSLQIMAAGGSGITARSNAAIASQVQVSSTQSWDIQSTLTISGALSLDAGVILTKKGVGNLVLSGAQNHGANSQLKMTEGTLHLANNLGPAARLAITGNSTSTDALVILDSDQDLSQLTITTGDAGNQALDLSSPTVSGAFRSLRIHAADLFAAKANLWALIRQTPGEGIYDFSLASHPNSAVGLAAIGNAVIIRPTRIGDVNLDGLVTIADFIDLSSNFGHSNVTWQEGDLNGDGLVTIGDFIDLAANFGRSYAGEAMAIPQADQQLLDAFAASHGVPEPASFGSLLLASLAARRPRRVQSAK